MVLVMLAEATNLQNFSSNLESSCTHIQIRYINLPEDRVLEKIANSLQKTPFTGLFASQNSHRVILQHFC